MRFYFPHASLRVLFCLALLAGYSLDSAAECLNTADDPGEVDNAISAVGPFTMTEPNGTTDVSCGCCGGNPDGTAAYDGTCNPNETDPTQPDFCPVTCNPSETDPTQFDYCSTTCNPSETNPGAADFCGASGSQAANTVPPAQTTCNPSETNPAAADFCGTSSQTVNTVPPPQTTCNPSETNPAAADFCGTTTSPTPSPITVQ